VVARDGRGVGGEGHGHVVLGRRGERAEALGLALVPPAEPDEEDDSEDGGEDEDCRARGEGQLSGLGGVPETSH
jgi:hypothetical protein